MSVFNVDYNTKKLADKIMKSHDKLSDSKYGGVNVDRIWEHKWLIAGVLGLVIVGGGYMVYKQMEERKKKDGNS
jgi:hypothetical protein